MSARRRTQCGSVVVEFALVVPLVLAFMLGVVQYGYQYWSRETAAAAAREAARRLIVGTDSTCTLQAAVDRASGPNIGSAAPTVTVTYAGGGSVPVRGDLVTVTVRLHSLDIGLLPVPDDGLVVESATNRVENVPIDPLDCTDP